MVECGQTIAEDTENTLGFSSTRVEYIVQVGARVGTSLQGFHPGERKGGLEVRPPPGS